MSTRTDRVRTGTAFSFPGSGTSVCEIGADPELAAAGVAEPSGARVAAADPDADGAAALVSDAAGAELLSDAAGAELDVLSPLG
jgi:hypothetical protein